MISQSIQDPADRAAATRASEADALIAASTFGAALRTSPEFASLTKAGDKLRNDTQANAAIDAFGRRQAELRMQTMFGTLTDAQRAELERLQTTMLAVPTVATYIAAEESFRSVCRETAAVVSAQTGIDFAANCRSGGCCG